MQLLLEANRSVFCVAKQKDIWDAARFHVLLPNNETMASLILNESHLIHETHVTNFFTKFLTHHYVWRAYKDHPDGLPQQYVENEHLQLPAEFHELINNSY